MAYTTGVLQNLPGADRELVSRMGFPIPAEAEDEGLPIALRALSVSSGIKFNIETKDQAVAASSDGILTSDGELLYDSDPSLVWSANEEPVPCDLEETEELEHWDLISTS